MVWINVQPDALDNRPAHAFLLGGRELGVHRQADYPIREVLSDRELRCSPLHIGERLLQVDGLWVINAKRNAGLLQVTGEVVP